ncbi:hypothetical protein [Streptomyces sp. NRRL B-24085]|uniref:hypothetical protein n=1 Tax=Streptomyces sp. NRRL B-24085 TaxID=1709476 RepID=UPI0007C6CEA6|nr:hypothetical protein [Streptomyces sp. NRRL B-24085]
MEARLAGLHTYQLTAGRTRLTRWQISRGIPDAATSSLRGEPDADHLDHAETEFMFFGDPSGWIDYDKRQFGQILGCLTRVVTGTQRRDWHVPVIS